MMYCNHYCNCFGKNCGYRTQDGYCALSPDIVYTDHTEQTNNDDIKPPMPKPDKQH